MYAVRYQVNVPATLTPDMIFGQQPLLYLGKFWFIYDGYSSEIIWINHQKGIAFPQFPNKVTEIGYILKPGCTITFTPLIADVDGSFGLNFAGGQVAPMLGKLPFYASWWSAVP